MLAILALGRGHREIAGAFWPTSPAYLVSPGLSERPCLRKTKRKARKMAQQAKVGSAKLADLSHVS